MARNPRVRPGKRGPRPSPGGAASPGLRSSDSDRGRGPRLPPRRVARHPTPSREGVRGDRQRSRRVSKFGRLRFREASRGSGAHASRVPRLRVVSGRLSQRRRSVLTPSEHERKGREPQNLADQGHDGRKRGDGAEDRERKDHGQAEILERREDRQGDLIVPGQADRSAECNDEDPDAECPEHGEKPERKEEFRTREKWAASGTRDRDDEKKE